MPELRKVILYDPQAGTDVVLVAGAIPVTGTISVTDASVGLIGAAVPLYGGQVAGPDATGNLRAPRIYDVDSGGGAEYTLGAVLRASAGGGSVETGTATNPLRVDPTGATTQPVSIAGTVAVSAAQLPAALVGGRLDENVGAWLGSTTPTVGQKLMAASLPMVIASDQTAVPVSGTVTATNASIGATGAAVPASATQVGGPDSGGLLRGPRVYDTDSGGGTEYTQGAVLRATAGGGSVETGTSANPLRVDPTGTTTQPVNVASWIGSTAPTVGQKTSANSIPVVLSSDLANVSTNVAQWGGSATTLGSKVSASSVPVVLASDQTQLPAALVGGRLDVNAGAWLGSTAPTVGQKTMANSVPVAIASDTDWVGQGGGAIPSRSVFVGGTDGANMRNFRLFDLDSGAGTQYIQGVNLRRTANGGSTEALGQSTMANSIPVVWASDFVPGNVTYTASITGLVADVTGATDIVTLFGSGTKTIYIMRVAVSATATAGVNTSTQLRKLSTVLTGGTSAAMTAVPHDSASAAATATPLSWTANPTGGGTLVGIVGTTKLNVQAPGTSTSPPTWVWKFGGPADAQPMTLRGTTQGLALNLNGAVLAGASFNVEISWTEA